MKSDTETVLIAVEAVENGLVFRVEAGLKRVFDDRELLVKSLKDQGHIVQTECKIDDKQDSLSLFKLRHSQIYEVHLSNYKGFSRENKQAF